VIRLEQGVVDSRSSTIDAVRRALEAAGIEFLSLREDSEGIRVRHNGVPRSNLNGDHDNHPITYTAFFTLSTIGYNRPKSIPIVFFRNRLFVPERLANLP
jgi:hypothetical protein